MKGCEGIVFFDDNCLLCNRFIVFLLKKDKKHHLRFGALNDETAAKYLSNGKLIKNRSVIFVTADKNYMKSDAVLKIFQSLGGCWKWTKFFYLVPRFIRNGMYDFIAKNRYRWFGTNKYCYLPTQSEKQYFLKQK